MKEEEELDEEIIDQIHKREDANSALNKILDDLYKNHSEAINFQPKRNLVRRIISRIFNNQ
jgi:hypothetical protein